MTNNSVILRDDIYHKIEDIGEADILVGIPSFNNARTIGHVVRAVQAGLTKYFPDKKSVLVNSDGGSSDGTMQIVEQTSVDFESILLQHRVSRFHKIVTSYQGIPGKGSAFRTIFEIARALKVEACVVVDADLRSITPEWIELLAAPIINAEFDYVSPYYHRHKYDGTITNTIIYPLTTALYGKSIRQPIGGDFGFSGRLASFYLTKNVWNTDVARFGIDIWMTTTAVANGFRICQSFLGAKIHDAKDPGADLSAMLYQVVSTAFSLMEEYAENWKSVKYSEPVSTFGFMYSVGLEPVNVNIDGMIEKFKLGVEELTVVYEKLLPQELIWFLKYIAAEIKEQFIFPDTVWIKIIYDFAIAYHRRLMNREHLIKSLVPIYLGKVASFMIETQDSAADKIEKRLEDIRKSFENETFMPTSRHKGE